MAPSGTFVNPILWVQFRLAGGWRNAIALVVGYCAIAALIAVFLFRVDLDAPPSSIAGGCLIVMSILQGAMLVLVGTGAVRRNILRDFTSNMFDSHRLTPVSGPSAMLGYIFGSNIGPLLLVAANVLIGLALCSVSGHPHSDWLLGSALQVVFAVMLWTASATAALCTRGKANLAPFLLVAGLLGGWFVVLAVPGLSLLCYGGAVGILDIMGLSMNLGLPGAVALAIPQLIVSGTVFWVGARKYRQIDRRACPAWLGFLLLAEAAVVGAVGIVVMPARPGMREFHLPDLPTQTNATLVTLALLAMLPLSAAAWAAADRERRGRLEPDGPLRRPISLYIGPLLAALIVVGAMVAIVPQLRGALYGLNAGIPLVLTELTLGLTAWMLVLWIAYRGTTRTTAAAWGGFWFFVVWIGPPLIDAILNTALAVENARTTWFTACSPAAAVFCIGWNLPVSLAPGIALHVVLIILLLALVTRHPVSAPQSAQPPAQATGPR